MCSSDLAPTPRSTAAVSRSRSSANETGRRETGKNEDIVVNHAPFVWGAYAVAVLGFGALVLASVLARARVRREIAARGLERKR